MQKKNSYTNEFKAKIVMEILKEEKTFAQISSEHKIHNSVLRRWYSEFVENLPNIFSDKNKEIKKIKEEYEKQVQDLYVEVGRLSTENTWLKKNLEAQFNRNERTALIDWNNDEISISKQTELLNLNRSTLYYKPVDTPPKEIFIKHRIDNIYTDYPFYGSRRITQQLILDGIDISRATVRKYMLEMGLYAIYPGPNLSKRNLQHKVYPYLLKGLAIEHPNHVWGIDITYIRLNKGWMYLVAIIDWYSRYVVSWELDQTLEIAFVLEAVNNALNLSIPKILNSDQGSHFTSPKYIDLLKESKVNISMDGRGRALDNIFTERLWRSLKYENIYIKNYETPREARLGINEYFEFYNNKRIHQSLEYKTPASVYFN